MLLRWTFSHNQARDTRVRIAFALLICSATLLSSPACRSSKSSAGAADSSGDAQSASSADGEATAQAPSQSSSSPQQQTPQSGSNPSAPLSGLNAQRLTLELSGAAVADGQNEVEVSVYFEDHDGFPLSGVTPDLQVGDSVSHSQTPVESQQPVSLAARFLSVGSNFVGRIRALASDPAPTPESSVDSVRCAPSDDQGIARCLVASTRSGAKALQLRSPVSKAFTDTVTFVHGPAARTVIVQDATNTSAVDGFSAPILVEIQDAFGNRVDTGPDASAPLTLEGITLGDRIDGTRTLTASAGRAEFSGISYRTSGSAKQLRIRKGSTQGVTATRSVAVSNSVTQEIPIAGSSEAEVQSASFSVSSGPLHALELASVPQEVIAGQPLPVEILAKDLYGNPVDQFLESVEVTTDDPLALAPGAVNFAESERSRKTLGQDQLSLRSAGQRVVSVRHPGTGLVIRSAPIRVRAGAVSSERSEIVASKISVNADGADESVLQVILKDAFGNPVEGASVALESDRPSGDTVVALAAATNASGVTSFKVRSQNPGISRFTVRSGPQTVGANRAVEFVDASAEPQSPSPTPSVVASASPSPSPSPSLSPTPTLRFSVQPAATLRAGLAMETAPVVTVEDGSGAELASASGNVTLSLFADSNCSIARAGTLSATTAAVSSSRATFTGLSLSGGIGTFYLKASHEGSVSACSSAIQTSGKLAFTAQPSRAGISENFANGSLQVTLQDEAGQTLSAVGASLQLTAHDGTDATCSGAPLGGVLSGSSSVAELGVADFAGVSYNQAAQIRLKVAAAGYAPSCSSVITIAPSYQTPASFCDQGDAGTTCVISTAKTLTSNEAMDIRLNQLQIKSGGSIVGFTDRTTQTCLVIRAAQGVEIQSGGKIDVSARGYTSSPVVAQNSWEPEQWGIGASGGGGCIKILSAGDVTVAGSLLAAGASSAQGGSIWIDAARVLGAGSLNAAGGAGAQGKSSSSSATACNNGPGSPGGNGGAVKIDGDASSFTGTVSVAGGPGGAAGSTGYKCSKPTASGYAASGLAGTFVKFNKTDLIVPTGVTLVMSDAMKAQLRTVTLKNGGKLITRVDEALSIDQLVTEAGSTFENHGRVVTGGLLLSGGKVDNRFGSLQVSSDAEVTAVTDYLGELRVEGHLTVASTLQSGGVAELSVSAGALSVPAGGAVSGDGVLVANASPLSVSVDTQLLVAGRLSANGASGSGGAAAALDINAGTLVGAGALSAVGGEGAQGSSFTGGATGCNNGPGYPGGAGGAITVTGDRTGFTGTVAYSGGLGGLAGQTGYLCSRPSRTGRAASGAAGSVTYY